MNRNADYYKDVSSSNLIYRLYLISTEYPIGEFFWNLRNNFKIYLENDKAKNSRGTSEEDDQAGKYLTRYEDVS